MREIIGNTTATPNPRPDWNQTDSTKADYIKNKPLSSGEGIGSIQQKNATAFAPDSAAFGSNTVAGGKTFAIDVEKENAATTTTTLRGMSGESGTYHLNCTNSVLERLSAYVEEWNAETDSAVKDSKKVHYSIDYFETEYEEDGSRTQPEDIYSNVYPDCGYITSVDVANKIITVSNKFNLSWDPERTDRFRGVEAYLLVSIDPTVGDLYYGWYAFVANEGNIAMGNYSMTNGRNNKALDNASHAEGHTTVALKYAHSEGTRTQAIGRSSHSEGRYTKTCGFASHAEGYGSTTLAPYSHAEGYGSIAGNPSKENDYLYRLSKDPLTAHAEGDYTIAASAGSHAEGSHTQTGYKYFNITKADTGGSRKQPRIDLASPQKLTAYDWTAGDPIMITLGDRGFISNLIEIGSSRIFIEDPTGEIMELISSGVQTGKVIALQNPDIGVEYSDEALYSHAEGEYTIAGSRASKVWGTYNIADISGKYIHIVGNGTADKRSNAHTLDKDGNAWFAGDVRVGDKGRLITEREVNNRFNSIDCQKSVTYAELVELRDTNNLAPGMNYRITDYRCTTSQEGTRAMDNKFDIIVQALSTNSLSEKARADYPSNSHKDVVCYSGDLKAEVLDESGNIIPGAIVVSYLEYVDNAEQYGGIGENGVSKDVFIECGYESINGSAASVLTLYKTDNENYVGADYADKFYYMGRSTLYGEEYDKWRKIEEDSGTSNDVGWDASPVYYYTNVVVENIGEPIIIAQELTDARNIPAWDLRYCLDNDASRFGWASEDGTGVIYYMKDEWGNECPYDFKNIQFLRDLDWQDKHLGFLAHLGIAQGDFQWLYTFSWYDNDAGEVSDLTTRVDLHSEDVVKETTRNNQIKPYIIEAGDKSSSQGLNNIVFIAASTQYSGMYYGIYNNVFEYDCHDCSLSNNTKNNTFGNSCKDIVLTEWKSGSLGNNCHDIEVTGYSNCVSLGDNVENCHITGVLYYVCIESGCRRLIIEAPNAARNVTIRSGVYGNIDEKTIHLENVDYPRIYEAPNTTHIILD